MTVCVVCPSDCPGVKAARLFEAYCSFRSNIPGIKHPKGAAICLFSSIRPDTNKYKPSRQQRNSRFGGFYSLGRQFPSAGRSSKFQHPKAQITDKYTRQKTKRAGNYLGSRHFVVIRWRASSHAACPVIPLLLLSFCQWTE